MQLQLAEISGVGKLYSTGSGSAFRTDAGRDMLPEPIRSSAIIAQPESASHHERSNRSVPEDRKDHSSGGLERNAIEHALKSHSGKCDRAASSSI